jgi:hypothetical protein
LLAELTHLIHRQASSASGLVIGNY